MKKSDLVEQSLKHIKDFENINTFEIILELKSGSSLNAQGGIYKGKKYSKKEWLFKTVANHIRKKPSMKDEPIIGNISMDISNFKSLKVKVS